MGRSRVDHMQGFRSLQVLKLGMTGLAKTTTGNIVNLISSDTQRFDLVSSLDYLASVVHLVQPAVTSRNVGTPLWFAERLFCSHVPNYLWVVPASHAYFPLRPASHLHLSVSWVLCVTGAWGIRGVPWIQICWSRRPGSSSRCVQ